ncbi:hypothetical protein B0H10DRAFT_2447693 [Mycena sp. CBHHK59/15]|nr:hypothetical protein B0H10DRAFT_2447693 [Mycena sp. CBHHK59/15]
MSSLCQECLRPFGSGNDQVICSVDCSAPTKKKKKKPSYFPFHHPCLPLALDTTGAIVTMPMPFFLNLKWQSSREEDFLSLLGAILATSDEELDTYVTKNALQTKALTFSGKLAACLKHHSGLSGLAEGGKRAEANNRSVDTSNSHSSLPLELLWEIFSLIPRHQPPWLLGLVCRSWRAAALALPTLWTSICVSYSNTTMEPGEEEPGASSLLRVQEQLKRSDQHPLEVDLTFYTDEQHPWQGTRLVDAVVQHSKRWRSFTLICDSHGADVLGRMPAAQGRVPNLERLTIEYRPQDHSSLKMSDFTVFAVAPKLKEVNVKGPDRRLIELSRLVLPWSQLTDFIVPYEGPDNALQIFRAAPYLVDCRILWSPPNDQSDGECVTLPHLRRLQVISARWDAK